ALGHLVGWRMAFAVLGLVAVGVAAVLAVLLPAVRGHPASAGRGPRAGHRDPTRRVVLLTCALIVAVIAAQQIPATYVAVWLEDIPRFGPALVPVGLLVIGVAGTV